MKNADCRYKRPEWKKYCKLLLKNGGGCGIMGSYVKKENRLQTMR